MVKIIEMKTADIIPYENNPRRNDEAVDYVANSIKEFGFKVPIVIDQENVIVTGHTRLKAAEKLGLDKVPCIVADDLTEEQIRAFRLADNKTNELSSWDMDKLEAELELLQDFDMSDFGFDFDEQMDNEINEIIEDEIPEVDEESDPIVKRGQVWKLGNHLLMCGDATNEDDVKQLMNDEKAELCFTSPPYNAGSLDIEGNKTTMKKYGLFDDNKTEDEYDNFIITNVGIMMKYADEVFYNIGLVENNKRSIYKLVYHYLKQFKDVIYWEKQTVAPHIQSGIINNLVEFILCFGDGKRKFKNAQFSQGTYWNVIKGPNASQNEYAEIHKATFPLYLPINIIGNFSNKNAIIIDCFGRTGTTLIACEQLNRKCRMMELDPKYCDVIIERWENLTEQKAELIEGID